VASALHARNLSHCLFWKIRGWGEFADARECRDEVKFAHEYVLLRGGATLDRDKLQQRGGWNPYLDKVYQAGGWARYAQAHRTRLVATFAPKLRLPADVIPLVVDFWANVGMY